MSKNVKEVARGANFTAAEIGAFDALMDYSAGETKGKLFLKEQIKSSGAELSFQLLPAGVELPFFHSHKQNEEIYIILKGNGQMQVDGDIINLSEGSVVRIAPTGVRCLKSAADSAMTYMVIQVKENSLQQWTGGDGELVSAEPKWTK